MSELVATFIDVSGEKSTATLNMNDQGGSVTITDIASLVTTAETALNGVSLATLFSVAFRQQFVDDPATLPASPYAQREAGMRFFYHSNVTGKKGRLTVPAPDMANCALLAGTDLFDPADTEVAALITWIESYVTINSEAVTVDSVMYIGRNN